MINNTFKCGYYNATHMSIMEVLQYHPRVTSYKINKEFKTACQIGQYNIAKLLQNHQYITSESINDGFINACRIGYYKAIQVR